MHRKRSHQNQKEETIQKSTIWLTTFITRKFKNRSLQNFQTWQFTSLSLRKQQRNGLEPLKFWIVYLPEKKSRVLLFFVHSGSLLPKRFVVSFFAWSVDKNGGSVAQGKTSSSCSILFPVYLKHYPLARRFRREYRRIVTESPRRSRGDYSPIFTSPEATNCFSIITLMIIRENKIKKRHIFERFWGLKMSVKSGSDRQQAGFLLINKIQGFQPPTSSNIGELMGKGW